MCNPSGASLAIEDEMGREGAVARRRRRPARRKAKAKGTTADLRKAAVFIVASAWPTRLLLLNRHGLAGERGGSEGVGQGFWRRTPRIRSIALCAAVVDAAPAEDEEDVQGDADGDFERERELDLDEDAISVVFMIEAMTTSWHGRLLRAAFKTAPRPWWYLVL